MGASEPDKGNFVDLVLEGAAKLPHLFTPGDIRTAGLLPFFAGVDTVGQTLAFAIYEVLQRPLLLQAVRDEIDSVAGDGPLRPELLREMELVQAVVLETLRLHPTAFGMSRTATADFEFAGHLVRRGQEVLVFTTICHLLPEFFPDPERFDVERYRGGRNEDRQLNAFVPFGRGPHTCLGSSFATIQLTATLATMLRDFELELPEPDRVFKPVLMPTPSLGKAFRVRLRGRRVRGASTGNPVP
jgi:cytochrome P450